MCLVLEDEVQKQEEDFLIWERCHSLDENWITTPLKFAAGAAGNLAGQTARGVGNVARGMVGNVGAAGEMGLGALQMLGGGGKKGWDRMKKGWGSAEKSGKRIGRGVTQTIGALSGISPILRGAQAASEPFFDIKGVYAPSNVKKGSFSDMFGMGSWEDGSKQAKPDTPQAKPDTPQAKPDTPQAKPDAPQAKPDAPQVKPDAPQPNEECKKLILAYKLSKNTQTRKALQKRMAIVDPVWYRYAMQKAKARISKS